MAASTHLSPRIFCLCCSTRIDFDFLRGEFGILDSLFGFCSPVCEVNYGSRLELGRKGTRLSQGAREFLVTLQGRVDAWQVGKTIAVHSMDEAHVVELAKAGLVVRHGRSGVTITVKGDIAFIRVRLLSGPRFSDRDPVVEQDPPEDDTIDPREYDGAEDAALAQAEARAGYWWGQS